MPPPARHTGRRPGRSRPELLQPRPEPTLTTAPKHTHVIATDHTWIDSEATDQLARIAALPGAKRAAGMPDLHAGAGAPIGAVLLADRVYPHLVGSDIGCGVAVWTLPDVRRPSPEKIAKRLDGLDTVVPGELPHDWAARFDAPHHDTLGTIGGGNHFLEVGAVDEVFDPALAQQNGLNPGALVVMIHTGSRGLGREVLAEHIETHGPVACAADALPEYLRRHDEAVRFGRANRAALALRVAARLHVALDPTSPLIDLCHNSVEPVGRDWLHRKGAAPNVPGPTPLAALPGSRGPEATSSPPPTTPPPSSRRCGRWPTARAASTAGPRPGPATRAPRNGN